MCAPFIVAFHACSVLGTRAASPLLRGGGVGGGETLASGASPKCGPNQCAAATIDWGTGASYQDGVFEFEVTIALDMQASSPSSPNTADENAPVTFDESNLRPLMHVSCCAIAAATRKWLQKTKLRNCECTAPDLQKCSTCNDRAGLLEEAGADTKFALLNEVCSSQYPVFKYGPSEKWFAIVLSQKSRG